MFFCDRNGSLYDSAAASFLVAKRLNIEVQNSPDIVKLPFSQFRPGLFFMRDISAFSSE
jgi:hypothetical protein